MPNTSVPAPEKPSALPGSAAPPVGVDAAMPHDSDRRSGRLALAGTSLALVAIVALGVRATSLSIWMDEAYSLNTAHRGLGDVIHHAMTFEFQPPLYFLALHAWLRIHDSIFFARVLSILAAGAAILLTHAVGRTLRVRRWYANPALVLAAMPFTQWASTEIRTSAFTMACAGAIMLAFVRLKVEERSSPRRGTVEVAVTWLLGLVSFYYLGFLLAGQTLAGWMDQRLRRPLLAVIGVVTIGMLPLAGMILSQKSGQEQMASTDAFTGASHGLVAVARWAGGFLFDSFVAVPTTAASPAYPAVTLLAALSIIVAATVGSRRGEALGIGRMLAVIVAVPIAVCLFFGVTHVAPTATRYCGAIAVVPLCISIGYAIDRASSDRLGRLMAAVTFLILGYSTISLERNRLPTEDWKSVAAQIRGERASAADPVFVFEPDAVLPLRHYYDSLSVHALPREPDLTHYSMATRRVDSVAQVDALVSHWVAPGQSFWVILRGAQLSEAGDASERTIRGWMASGARQQSERVYHRIHVYHLVRAPSAGAPDSRGPLR